MPRNSRASRDQSEKELLGGEKASVVDNRIVFAGANGDQNAVTVSEVCSRSWQLLRVWARANINCAFSCLIILPLRLFLGMLILSFRAITSYRRTATPDPSTK